MEKTNCIVGGCCNTIGLHCSYVTIKGDHYDGIVLPGEFPRDGEYNSVSYSKDVRIWFSKHVAVTRSTDIFIASSANIIIDNCSGVKLMNSSNLILIKSNDPVYKDSCISGQLILNNRPFSFKSILCNPNTEKKFKSTIEGCYNLEPIGQDLRLDENSDMAKVIKLYNDLIENKTV